MDKQQASALLRLRESREAEVLFSLVGDFETDALSALRKHVEVNDIYRKQGELRAYDLIRGLFDDAEQVLGQDE